MSARRNLILVLAVLVAAAAGLLAACGGSDESAQPAGSGSPVALPSPGGGGSVVMWDGATDIERKANDAFVAKYNATDPGFTVQAKFVVSRDYALTKLLTALAGGKAPDISYQFGSSMANLAKSPKVVDLGPIMEQTPGFDWNDFYPAERLATTVNGMVIGVPALVDNLAIVYNKKLFDQAGIAYPTKDWTWTDFRNAAKQLTNASAKQFGWAYVNDGTEDTVWRFLAVLWQANGDLLNADNTKSALDSDAGRKAMQLLYDMAVTDKSVYLDKGDGNYLNLFNSGKIAMLWTGPWDISSINSDVDYGVEILPADVSHATIAGPDNYVVLDNGSQQVANAWAFLQWFLSPEVHLDYAIATGNLPIRKSETELPAYQDYLAKYPASEVFVANLDNVTKARPNIPQYPKISMALGQAVQSVLLGSAQPDQAITVASQAIDAILAAGQ